MKLKTPGRPDFQGDLMIMEVAEIPASAKPVSPEDGYHVLAHSESGHDHACVAERTVLYRDPKDEMNAWLSVIGLNPVALEHRKSGPDAHEAIELPPANYLIRRQREYTPEGLRMVAD